MGCRSFFFSSVMGTRLACADRLNNAAIPSLYPQKHAYQQRTEFLQADHENSGASCFVTVIMVLLPRKILISRKKMS